jgi:hypothetical protein
MGDTPVRHTPECGAAAPGFVLRLTRPRLPIDMAARSALALFEEI